MRPDGMASRRLPSRELYIGRRNTLNMACRNVFNAASDVAPLTACAIISSPTHAIVTNISIVHVTPRAQCRLYVSHVMFRLKPHPRQTVAAVVKVCRLWLGRSGVEKCRVDHKIGSKTFMVAELLAKASS